MASGRLAFLAGAVCLLLTGLPDARARMEAADDLCIFETLYPQVKCVLEPPGPCDIYVLPDSNCYQIFPLCRDNKTFIENEDFVHYYDYVGNITNLTIWNRKEDQLLLLTMVPDEVWWRLELPKGEHTITITDLPGRLNQSNPMLAPVPCTGCPPPRIKFAAMRKLHKFEIMVPGTEEKSQHQKPETDVTIKVFVSNETIYSEENCRRPMYANAIVNGSTNELITFGDLYSTEYCFVVDIKYASFPNTQSYICGKVQNMTELPDEPFEAQIDIPTWWIVTLLLVVVALALGSLTPFAIHKGLWPFRSRSRKSGHGAGGSANGNNNSAKTDREVQPFLEPNGVLPNNVKIVTHDVCEKNQ